MRRWPPSSHWRYMCAHRPNFYLYVYSDIYTWRTIVASRDELFAQNSKTKMRNKKIKRNNNKSTTKTQQNRVKSSHKARNGTWFRARIEIQKTPASQTNIYIPNIYRVESVEMHGFRSSAFNYKQSTRNWHSFLCLRCWRSIDNGSPSENCLHCVLQSAQF